MSNLNVFISKEFAGTLSSIDGVLSFRYDRAYSGPELSLALPFSCEPQTGKKVRAWFSNLLPDRPEVVRGMALAQGKKASVFDLLEHYGLDLPGAVQIVGSTTAKEFEDRTAGYREIADSEMYSRLAALVDSENETLKPFVWATKNEHWSLGGNQAKIALRRFNDRWYACEGDGASNVIVKPGVGHLAAQALDECATMRLLKLCNIPCANTWMEKFEDIDVIVIERYDRITDQRGNVLRLHQEDLCQALSYMPEKKYAEDGGPSAPEIMTLLAKASDNSQERFFDALLFNHLTASTDAHAKNYSLIHLARGSFRLAPLYDVASLAPYLTPRRTPYRVAMGIGGETRIGALRKTVIERFARSTGLDQAWIFERSYELIERIRTHLPRVFEEPDLAGVAGLDELACRMIPRITKLCQATERNLSRTGHTFHIPDITRLGGSAEGMSTAPSAGADKGWQL